MLSLNNILLIMLLVTSCAQERSTTFKSCNIEWMETSIQKCVKHCTYENIDCEDTCVNTARETYCK